jgi:hypothetical protein
MARQRFSNVYRLFEKPMPIVNEMLPSCDDLCRFYRFLAFPDCEQVD